MAYVTLQVVSLHAYCCQPIIELPWPHLMRWPVVSFFWKGMCHAGWGISVPWLGIEPRTPVGLQSQPLDHPGIPTPMVLKSHVACSLSCSVFARHCPAMVCTENSTLIWFLKEQCLFSWTTALLTEWEWLTPPFSPLCTSGCVSDEI